MKTLIILAVAAVMIVTGISLSGSEEKTEPVDATTAAVNTEDASTKDESSEEVKGALTLIEKAVAKIKTDVSEFLKDFNDSGNKEEFEKIEQEATAFVEKTIKEIKTKIPEDLEVEFVDFDVNKMNDDRLQTIKNECEESSKYNPDKISTGFDVSGKIEYTSKGKTSVINGSAIIIKVKNDWKIYDSNFDLPDDFSLDGLFSTE